MGSSKFQTVKYDSIFTQLDFRTKLVIIGVVTLIAFLWQSPIAGGSLTIGVAIACIVAGVRLDYLVVILKFMVPFYIFLLLIMGFFSGIQVQSLMGNMELTPILILPKNWWLIGGGTMTLEGLLYGLNIVFKTLTMILVIPLGIFTTNVNQITVSLVQIRVPYKILFIFTSTLRFVPFLLEEVQSILDAQRLRGLNLQKMNWFKRGKIYAAIGVPLILNAMAKSQKLEIVLQSKAFSGSSNRTYLHETFLTYTDYAIMVIFGVFLVLAIALYFTWGIGKFAWLLSTV